eukprot:NODE_19_length_39463_cov_0.396073.p27 type:complete len:105 gc:universal NODE_19_length_39463_cov_0.396073:4339-4653(+)
MRHGKIRAKDGYAKLVRETLRWEKENHHLLFLCKRVPTFVKMPTSHQTPMKQQVFNLQKVHLQNLSINKSTYFYIKFAIMHLIYRIVRYVALHFCYAILKVSEN